MKLLNKLFKTNKKEAKRAMKELMIEQLVEKAEAMAQEVEELKAKIAILSPTTEEEKKQMGYIG